MLATTIMALVSGIVTIAPKIISAGIDISELIGTAKKSLDRIVERSPEFASNEEFAKLKEQTDALGNELVANANARDNQAPSAG